MSTVMTFSDAVKETVYNLLSINGDFSVYDITSVLRDAVNYNSLQIPEKLVSGEVYQYAIEHNEVRTEFTSLCNSGAFFPGLDRRFNGSYYVYFEKKLVPPVMVVNAAPVTIANRIMNYMVNCEMRHVTPTLKKIQSAIKRGARSTGVTYEQIKSHLINMGYSVPKNR